MTCFLPSRGGDNSKKSSKFATNTYRVGTKGIVIIARSVAIPSKVGVVSPLILFMRYIKRLDTFILGKFLQLFVGAFFICLFVFMMQFTWRWINELVGKGLTFDIFLQFFYYAGITLVPLSLPLAVLLAALITFGNMGENLELLSMKAAGVPLVRVMMPVLFFVIPLTGISFHFQNTISPNAQKSLRLLLSSIYISQSALEIPEGVFYSGVRNMNIFVEKKDVETGMLYHTIIYKTDQGFDRAQIVLADSAKIEVTADKEHLRLTLWSGEQFQNLKSDNMSVFDSKSVPYDRETFSYKQILVDFDSNFTQLSEDQVRSMPSAKNLNEIAHDVDSMNRMIDADALRFFQEVTSRQASALERITPKDSAAIVRRFAAKPVNFDTLVAKASAEQVFQARQTANAQLQSLKAEYQWRSEGIKMQEHDIRRHWIEWHLKFAQSLACLLFLFVGAPLGAIIRKGGLGMPTVISVGIFIIYYIINTSGMKMARDGNINVAIGMWASTFILVPAGIYLTVMANRDSTVFNIDAYVAFFRNLFGLRTKRHLFRKEVIITPPDYALGLERLSEIRNAAQRYQQGRRLWVAPNYFRLFFRRREDEAMVELSEQIETMVADLANTTDYHLLQWLNELPIIGAHDHTTPFKHRRYNYLCGAIFPIGLLMWGRIWRFRLRLLKDLKQIVKTCDHLEAQIRHNI